VRLEGDRLVLGHERGGHAEGLERHRSLIAKTVATVTGHAVEIGLEETGAPRGESKEPRRLNGEADREERLRVYRDKDPSLDAVADAEQGLSRRRRVVPNGFSSRLKKASYITIRRSCAVSSP